MATRFKSAYDSPPAHRNKLYAIRVKLLREDDVKFYESDTRWLCDWGAGVVHGEQKDAFIFTEDQLKVLKKVLDYLAWLFKKDEHLAASYKLDYIEVDVQTFEDMATYNARQTRRNAS